MPFVERGSDIYEPDFVKGVFDRCSRKYISFSYVCSFGFTERWRRQCVELLPAPLTDRPRGFDLMAGTGEAWPHFLQRFPATASITAVDISPGMHARALKRLHRYRAHKIEFVEDNVLQSALVRESADFVISTFGLKTFNEAQHAILAELVARTLKPGGSFSFVEASDPKGWILRPFYLFHLNTVLPFIERVALRGAQDFAMIGTYSTSFGNARSFAEMLRRHGLIAEYRELFFGCASAVSGRKPAGEITPSGRETAATTKATTVL